MRASLLALAPSLLVTACYDREVRSGHCKDGLDMQHAL